MNRAYTGEGFKKEKALAYIAIAISACTLLVFALDFYQNSIHRKITKELAEEQLKEIKAKNGNGKT
jgi:hypothetical protein